jgi:hypothetical protein
MRLVLRPLLDPFNPLPHDVLYVAARTVSKCQNVGGWSVRGCGCGAAGQAL